MSGETLHSVCSLSVCLLSKEVVNNAVLNEVEQLLALSASTLIHSMLRTNNAALLSVQAHVSARTSMDVRICLCMFPVKQYHLQHMGGGDTGRL